MIFQELIPNLQIVLLVFARVLAMVQVAPLLSSVSFPQIGKIGLSIFITILLVPAVIGRGYFLPSSALEYGLLLIGEALLGILIGFLVLMVFSIFQIAGQFFSLQMGFGAAEVFDPVAQIQIPLLGQFFNLLAMFVFLTISGLHKFILVGVFNSFQAVRAIDLVIGNSSLANRFARSLGGLFQTALTIALPIFGSLLLVSIALGLLAKAAPQMNLLILGFPISIGAGFVIFLVTLPLIFEAVASVIDNSFEDLLQMYVGLRGSPIPSSGGSP